MFLCEVSSLIFPSLYWVTDAGHICQHPSGVRLWTLAPPLEVRLGNRYSILKTDQVSASLKHYLDWQFLPPQSSGILLARFLYVVPCHLLWVSRVRFTVDLGPPDSWFRKELCKTASCGCSGQVPRKENPSESPSSAAAVYRVVSFSPSFYLFKMLVRAQYWFSEALYLSWGG